MSKQTDIILKRLAKDYPLFMLPGVVQLSEKVWLASIDRIYPNSPFDVNTIKTHAKGTTPLKALQALERKIK